MRAAEKCSSIGAMTKDEAIKRAGSEARLAALLGVSRQAVNKWESIPPLRVYQLRELRRHWFRRPRATSPTEAA